MLLIGQLPNGATCALGRAVGRSVCCGRLFFRRLKRGFADVL